MTGIENIIIEKAIVHKIVNPTRGEALKFSEQALTLNDSSVQKLLLKYMLGAVNENELNRFTHLHNIAMNEVFNYVQQVFNEKEKFIAASKKLAEFLYSKSTHVKVKEGELYVVKFSNVLFDNKEVQAIGIFKSENKEAFLKVLEQGKNLELVADDGINAGKPEKGCVVFKAQEADGYRVCVIDNVNRQPDAQYWVNDFLQVQPIADSYHHTDKYLALCKQFVTNQYPEEFEVSKSDQLELLNRSMDYFKTKENFSLEGFTEEVIGQKDVVDSFMAYKKKFETAKNYEIENEFDINLSAVKKQQKLFKSVLKLDKNFHIYIHGRRDLIEKGIDEQTGRKYYKIYFEEEH